MCDLPRSFLALCIYHITSHPARQAPSSWLIRRFDSAWLLLSAAVWGKIFMLPAPQRSHQPPASQAAAELIRKAPFPGFSATWWPEKS